MNRMSGKTLLLRADASPEIGNGHVLRLLALGQAWIDSGGSALLLSRKCPTTLLNRFADQGIMTFSLGDDISSEEDSLQTARLADEHNVDCVAIDGYDFDFPYQSQLRISGRNSNRILLVLDDYHHLNQYDADLIVNQNLGATAEDYRSLASDTMILAGTRYTLLRREFVGNQIARKNIRNSDFIDEPVRLLITLGGADPDNVSRKVLLAILELAESLKEKSKSISLAVRLLIGSNNRHRDQLQAFSRGLPQIELLYDVSNMVEQYVWADLAIAAGGSTNWELSMFGIPRLVVVLAENQQEIANSLEAAGVAINLGDHRSVKQTQISDSLLKLISNQSLREFLSDKSRQLVDGKGAARVVEALLQIIETEKRKNR